MDIKFELSLQESNLIIKALSKLPYEESAVLITKLVEIGNKQVEAKKE